MKPRKTKTGPSIESIGRTIFGRAIKPSKGGDGGVVAVHARPTAFAGANERVYLTCVSEADKTKCIPTRDLHDRAHGVMDPLGRYLPAARRGKLVVKTSKSRKYPPILVNSRGVADGSAFDETYSRERWLISNGLRSDYTEAKCITIDRPIPVSEISGQGLSVHKTEVEKRSERQPRGSA